MVTISQSQICESCLVEINYKWRVMTVPEIQKVRGLPSLAFAAAR